uniref:Uncharacterized protein n=1 Tax=Manihot esculenta TaxID=3983 RepID=A0A2C9VYY7_MANES
MGITWNFPTKQSGNVWSFDMSKTDWFCFLTFVVII